MRIREHFLLGTEQATISVTAKTDCERPALFRHAVDSILTRYQEEFGVDACQALVQSLKSTKRPDINWRLRPEDSCWNHVEGSR
ncbi:hypothetical protein Alches_12070 [Alicyclobacillus hesperidum subsp. aegles]|uniref:hypothetical protein n=1 Tax=Alicyclobacillus hesperidum TaxID=89784 RepID=UPI0007192FE2|nr:hypothetical protein [Alicyclobacillus hesperidum]KRW92465.1 hypothetical protein SD51_02870 [Alicyclobacillus tengchongensis]GLG01168.1 hypothetical protein Alches_12070 [Alicyclobacillus hesperidum subsp. aegles]